MRYPQGNISTADKTLTHTTLWDKAKHSYRAQEPWPIGKGNRPLKYPSKHNSRVSGKYEADIPYISLDGSHLTKDAEYFYFSRWQVRTFTDDALPIAFTTTHRRVACPLPHQRAYYYTRFKNVSNTAWGTGKISTKALADGQYLTMMVNLTLMVNLFA